MKKVYIAAFGSGMGHASRMVVVARTLVDSGCDVMFSSSGEVAQWLRSKGYRCNDVPLVDVVFTDGGAFSAKETAKFSPLIFGRLYKQVGVEARNIISYSPDVVLSDSMLSTVMASKLLGLETVSVFNQLRLESSPRTPRIAAQLLSTGSITVGNAFLGLSGKMLLPDLPPPFTISEKNLWNSGSVGRRAQYIGFLTSPPAPTEDGLTRKLSGVPAKKVYWQISGPAKTRNAFLAKAMEIARALAGEYIFVISAGDPLGSNSPREIEGGYLYGWCPVKDRLMEICDVVVSRAGHMTISELVLRSRPSILVPIPSQTEQLGNATKAQKLGVAIMLDEQQLSGGEFRNALRRIEGEDFDSRAVEVQEVARRYNAVEEIVRALGC